MKLLTLGVLVTCFCFSVQLTSNEQKLFVNFLKKNNLNYGILFYCESLDANAWTEVIENEFTYFSFYDVSSVKFKLSETWNILRFNYRLIGIMLDISCEETPFVFYNFSRFHYFNASYNWLMLSDNLTDSMKLLGGQNINLDAEITLAVFSDVEKIDAKLYDIYNPSFNGNGKIIVKPKGFWNQNYGINITLKGSKFDQRSNLNGIVMNAGIVVTGVGKNQTILEYLKSEHYQKKLFYNFTQHLQVAKILWSTLNIATASHYLRY